MYLSVHHSVFFFFFFNDTATTEIYTLSLHDALPISLRVGGPFTGIALPVAVCIFEPPAMLEVERRAGIAPAGCLCADRKSTRLNSSHGYISYAVFCLKKKKIR